VKISFIGKDMENKLTKKEMHNLYKYYLNGDIRSAFDVKETSCVQATGTYYYTDRKMMEGSMKRYIK
jgi:hypothetical protein